MDHTNTPELGWCLAYTGSPTFRPQHWYIYLHTPAGHYRLQGITFPSDRTARTWAVRNLPGLPEYE